MSSQNQNNQGNVKGDLNMGQSGRDLIQGDHNQIENNTYNQTFYTQSQWDKQQIGILKQMQDIVHDRLHLAFRSDQANEVVIPLFPTAQAPIDLRRKSTPTEPQAKLAPQDTILQIFFRADICEKLLILGDPGAGKTTTLLLLARSLLERALSPNPSPGRDFIPILFELSTWKEGKLEDWLIKRLKKRFKLPETEGKAWLDSKRLLPLLDGLDELSPAQQQKCIVALNQFAADYPQIVICCRVQDYAEAGIELEAVNGQVRLALLNDAQIEQYLKDLGMGKLWLDLQASPDMQTMLQPDANGNPGILRVPLLLNMAAIAYLSQPAGQPFTSRAQLYDQYIAQRLSDDTRKQERHAKSEKHWVYATRKQEPNWSATRPPLTWLAQQLQRHAQIDLNLYELQPSWLGSSRARSLFSSLYKLSTGSIMLVLLGLTTMHFLSRMSDAFNQTPQLNWVELTRLVRSLPLFQGVSSDLIQWIAAILWFLSIPVSGLMVVVWLGVLAAGMGVLSDSWEIEFEPEPAIPPSERRKLKSRWFVKLLLAMGHSLITALANFRAGFASILAALTALPILYQVLSRIELVKELATRYNWPAFVMHSGRDWLLSVAIAFLLITAFGFSTFFLQYFWLRIAIAYTNTAPWNLKQFLDYCTERYLLQRIGGRYRFLHRELLDHIANLRV
jgi:hypothetical protein